MTTEIIKEVQSLAMLALQDSQYQVITSLIQNKNYNKLRVYVDDILERIEMSSLLIPEDSKLQEDMINCNKISNLVTHECVEHATVWAN